MIGYNNTSKLVGHQKATPIKQRGKSRLVYSRVQLYVVGVKHCHIERDNFCFLCIWQSQVYGSSSYIIHMFVLMRIYKHDLPLY